MFDKCVREHLLKYIKILIYIFFYKLWYKKIKYDVNLRSNACVHPHVNWEARYTICRTTLELKCNNWTNLWWILSLTIIKARPDLELSTVLFSHEQCTHHTRAAACSLLVSNNCSLSILESFYFQQNVATLSLILWLWVFDHDSLTFASANFVHQGF